MRASGIRAVQAFSAPFRKVAYMQNLRDLGGYPIKPLAGLPDRKSVKRDLFFRSAAPKTPANAPTVATQGEGGQPPAQTFASLGLSTIFDLRSTEEFYTTTAAGSGYSLYTIPPGAGTRVHAEAHPEGPADPETIAIRYGQYMDKSNPDGAAQVYLDILKVASPAFTQVFRHVHDRPNDRLLIHCSGGKDRTGIISAFALRLAGVPDEVIATEYYTTELGFPPEVRKAAVDRLVKSVRLGLMGAKWAEIAGRAGDPVPRVVTEALEHFLSARRDGMLSTLKMVDSTFGGVKAYLTYHCGFSRSEILRIQDHLTSTEEPTIADFDF